MELPASRRSPSNGRMHPSRIVCEAPSCFSSHGLGAATCCVRASGSDAGGATPLRGGAGGGPGGGARAGTRGIGTLSCMPLVSLGGAGVVSEMGVGGGTGMSDSSSGIGSGPDTLGKPGGIGCIGCGCVLPSTPAPSASSPSSSYGPSAVPSWGSEGGKGLTGIGTGRVEGRGAGAGAGAGAPGCW